MLDSVSFPWILALVVPGYLWRKHKKLKTALEGAVSSLIGYYLVVLGAQMTALTLQPVRDLMQAAFGIDGGIMNSEVFGAVLLRRFSLLGLPILLLGFLVNLLLARLTKAKGVYLTGHHFLYMALFTAFFLQTFTNLAAPWILLLGAALTGLWGYGTVALTSPIIRRVTGTGGTGMANSCACASLIGAAAGWIFGSPKDRYDSESATGGTGSGNVPIMAFAGTLIVYLVLALLVGPEKICEIFGSERPWLMACLIRSLLYGAQVALLVHGIRLLVSNIIVMFWDLANRLVPGLWVGLDASALIGYSPRAWRAGYLYCTAGGIFTMALMIALRVPFVPLLSLTSYYFVGGVGGVCGNTYAGKRGAKAAGFLTGVAATVLIALMMARTGGLSELGASFGETEYGIYGLFLQLIARLFH